MKAIAIIIAAIALSSCGTPVRVGVDFTDPETGLTLGGSYSAKGVIIDVSK